jgi:inner membrane transporter RhtA
MATREVPGWMFAVVAMAVLQLGAALTTSLYPLVGPAGTGWLRLVGGALIFLALVRPNLRSFSPTDLRLLVLLGLVTAVMTIAFQFAVFRIGLSMTVPIQFLGPLAVGVFRAQSGRQALWPVLALVGVVALTKPWTGTLDLLGVGYALLAGLGWALYIVLTQAAGDQVSGLRALAITVPVAAIATTFVGLPEAWEHITPLIVIHALGLAVLMPVVPFILELVALKRLTAAAFGTLMAGEPALAALFGVLLLGERLDVLQLFGLTAVIVAGVAAERSGRRKTPNSTTPRPSRLVGKSATD